MKNKSNTENKGGTMEKRRRKRNSEWSATSIAFALTGCLVVGLILFFGIRLLTQQSQNTTTPPSSPTGQPGVVIQQPGGGGQSQGAPPANKGQGYSSAFLNTVRQNIAQGLHLTVDQVTSEISSGKQIADIAAAQGVSSTQLHTIEVNAYQAAFNQAVQNGTYTQDQANTYMENYRQRDPGQLNDGVISLFGGMPGTPQAGG
jgi:hypothetical protein